MCSTQWKERKLDKPPPSEEWYGKQQRWYENKDSLPLIIYHAISYIYKRFSPFLLKQKYILHLYFYARERYEIYLKFNKHFSMKPPSYFWHHEVMAIYYHDVVLLSSHYRLPRF